MVVPPETEDHLAPLIQSLVLGFETLLKTVHDQRQKEKVLRERLDFAANEYERIIAADGSATHESVDSSEVVRHLRQPVDEILDLDSSSVIKKAKLQIHTYKSTLQKSQQKMASGRCPMTGAVPDPEDMEHDFTTPGKQGNLGCPFARMAAKGEENATNGVDDPVAAEFHQEVASVRSRRTEGRPVGACPIRFLDQHSPEEIAQYFENHKHEIPRSHEICVRRYQGNENSVRQLDAKYGSLVNMIQGLGVKHKAYLPEKDRIEAQDNVPDEAVEKWAENVDPQQEMQAEVQADPSALENEEPRISRFDQPLREIRVGESPSRPWGISVPLDKEPSPSALQSEAGVDDLKITADIPQAPRVTAGKCPVDHTKIMDQEQKPPVQSAPVHDEGQPKPGPQIVFNGPVFFGYSAEQVAMLLQTGNLGTFKTASG